MFIDIVVGVSSSANSQPAALTRRLKALGHPDRLRLLRLMTDESSFPGNLVDVGSVGVCVNDLAKQAGLPQSTTSHHLGVMSKAGLLEVTDHGQWRYVRPRASALREVSASIDQLIP